MAALKDGGLVAWPEPPPIRRPPLAMRESLGGRVEWCVSGGASLDPELARLFTAAGITVLEGYGLIETSAVVAADTPETVRIGTVGRPLPGVEVAISSEGEVLVRGPNVFQGYWSDDGLEDATEDGASVGRIRAGPRRSRPHVGVVGSRSGHIRLHKRCKSDASGGFARDPVRMHQTHPICQVPGPGYPTPGYPTPTGRRAGRWPDRH